MSNDKDKKQGKVDKIVPSKLENIGYHIIYNTIGEHIPENLTPNQITLIGAIGSLMGIIFAYLAKYNLLFLIGTICGISSHYICDDLDGFVARKRKMTSLMGGYFDLLTDILHITYLLIALAFAGILSFKLTIFLVPVYAMIIFTAMNSILYMKEFPFPKCGPVETHLFFIAICVGTMVTGNKVLFSIQNIDMTFANILCVIGAMPMYFEMIRLQIRLMKQLHQKDITTNE